MKKNIIKIKESIKALEVDILDDSAIYKWIADIERAFLNSSRQPDWNLVGKAVVLEAEEEEDVHDTLNLVATTLKIPLCIIGMPNVIKNVNDWSKNISTSKPMIIYLEPGPWHGDNFKELSENTQHFEFSNEELIEFRSHLIDLVLNKLQKKPVIIVTSVKKFDQLDTSFRCIDLFDRRIEVPKWTDEKLFNRFASSIGQNKLSKEVLRNKLKVAALLRAVYPDKRRRLLMEKALKRVAWREERLIEYSDLVFFATYGTGESRIPTQTKSERYRHAVHEAGHTVIEHLCSRDNSVPAFCSILPNSDMHGVVVPDYDSLGMISRDLSYIDIKNKIKALLAGRAAEHLILGEEEVSANGSSSDLEHASYLAKKLIADNGFYIDAKKSTNLAKNLLVFSDKASPMEGKRIETISRRLLESLYLETLKVLRLNKMYLENIIDELIKRNFLLSSDIRNIYQAQQPKKIVNS